MLKYIALAFALLASPACAQTTINNLPTNSAPAATDSIACMHLGDVAGQTKRCAMSQIASIIAGIPTTWTAWQTFANMTVTGSYYQASAASLGPNLELDNSASDDTGGYFTMTKSRGSGSAINHDRVLNIVGKANYAGTLYPSADISFYMDGDSSANPPSKIYRNTTSGNAGTGQLDQWDIYDSAGHQAWHQAVNPTATCGTSPGIRTYSTDTAGAITEGTSAGGSCTITFATPFPETPFCNVTTADYTTIWHVALSASAITVTTPINWYSEITWQCFRASAPGS